MIYWWYLLMAKQIPHIQQMKIGRHLTCEKPLVSGFSVTDCIIVLGQAVCRDHPHISKRIASLGTY
jgi:hypothetical protein